MYAFVPALGASLLWLTVQPIISYAVRSLPRQHKREALALGLFVAMLSGTVALTLIVVLNGTMSAIDINPYSALAGLLTYPIATGFFYMASHAFDSRAELASQFSRVKPVFTMAAALLIFHEPLTRGDTWALALVMVGVVAMLSSALGGHIAWPAFALGMAAALAWAAGEGFVKAGFSSGGAFQDTWFALAVSTVAMATLMPLLVRDWHAVLAGSRRWLVAFSLHGVLSFALAYSLFFRSVATLGLSVTIVLTAFWPVLAMLLAWFAAYRRQQPYPVTATVWAASALLVAGSIVQAVSMRG